MNRGLQWLSATAIFLGGVLLRSIDLFTPWIGVHNAWAGARYGNIARNYLRYGYAATELGPVTNFGLVQPAQFEFYYHYPPLLVLLVSFSYRVFGVHEWSARLVPWLCSVGLMALVYAFTRRYYSARVALWALLFTAVMPIEAYYGTHVDVYGTVVVFFTTLALYSYACWIDADEGGGKYLALCLAAIVLGCLTSWFTFFLVPLLIAHYRWISARRDATRDRQIWLTAASAVAVFAVFMVHRRVLMGSGRHETEGTLLEKLLLRVTIQTPSGERPGLLGLVRGQARDFARLYSVPVLLLAGGWIGLTVARVRAGRLQRSDWFVLMLLGYGLLHNAVFPSFLLGHDFMVVCFMPFIAIAAALALDRLLTALRLRDGGTMQRVVAAAALMMVVGPALLATRRLRWEDSTYPASLKRWGQLIQTMTGPADVVLACSREDDIFSYYADRHMKFGVTTPARVRDSTAQKPATLLVCPVRHAVKLNGSLDHVSASSVRTIDGLVVYVLKP